MAASDNVADGEGKSAKRFKGERDASVEDAAASPAQQPKFLLEADVGITQFVTPGWDGFDAIIKHRFSDFFVNEIDTQGSVVHLTSYTDVDDPEPPKTAEEREVEELDVPQDADEAFHQGFVRLEGILGAEDARRLREHLEVTDEQTLEQRTLVLDRDLDKDERKGVYKITNNFLPTQVTCETVGGKLKFIRRARGDTNPGDKRDQQRRGWRGPQWRHAGDHCYFVMQKENHDSMEVLQQIARNLKIGPRSLGMAGTKDKRGITVQRCSAFRIDHTRLIWASKKLKGARLGNYSYGASELKLGDLGGNQFQIILRHVQGANAESLGPVLEGIRTTGFINYYGMQRFGTQSISSHAVGIAVLKADWNEAVDLILRPRQGDGKEIDRARKVWSESRDAKAALDLLPPKGALAEYNVLLQFVKSGSTTNDAAAFAAVPRNLRLMYVHAYQSYIWNAAVSERIRLFGVTGPVPGDLVVPADTLSAATRGPGVAASDEAGGAPTCVKPTLVTADNASEYTIYDVVLPLPGWSVEYPENEVKAIYLDLMKKDGLSPFGLDKHPLKEYRLAGAYRHLVIKPRDFSYEWMRYNDDMQPLARSDSDAIEGKHIPESIDFGEHVALKLRFDLPSSAYATMLLRELMRQETAAGHQTKLSSKTGYAAGSAAA
ncbi:multisubstrate pseudouridine synthase 7 [Coemansia biformis]|uniref:Multisubstrate pseudouridine synthase 7 n=1 Tax=Coemansia biformis TaxID=1286918 RepID=A0A9W7YGV6_9FUNG|nr:multisubstrate pseudouridine synthase 7 [Coemansia biformis]